jgi:hypothetical protein
MERKRKCQECNRRVFEDRSQIRRISERIANPYAPLYQIRLIDEGIEAIKGYLEGEKQRNPELYLMLSLLYEEKKDYKGAIATLNKSDARSENPTFFIK